VILACLATAAPAALVTRFGHAAESSTAARGGDVRVDVREQHGLPITGEGVSQREERDDQQDEHLGVVDGLSRLPNSSTAGPDPGIP